MYLESADGFGQTQARGPSRREVSLRSRFESTTECEHEEAGRDDQESPEHEF